MTVRAMEHQQQQRSPKTKSYEQPVNRFAIPLLMVMIVRRCLPTIAQSEESRWNLRLRGMLVDGDQSFSIDDPSGDTVLAGGNGSLGLRIAAEYRISRTR